MERRGIRRCGLLELSRFNRDAPLIGQGAGLCGPSSVCLAATGCVCLYL